MLSPKLSSISELRLNRRFNGIYRCIQKNVLISKMGEPYINIYIQDSTGVFPGKIWDSNSFFINRFVAGDIVTVKGEVKSYNTNNFAEIIHIDTIGKGREAEFGEYLKKLKSISSWPYDKSSRVLDIVSSLDVKSKKLLLDIVAGFTKHSKSLGPDTHMINYSIFDEVLLRSLALSQSFSDVSPELSREYLSLFVVLILSSRKKAGLRGTDGYKGIKDSIQIVYKYEKSIRDCTVIDFDVLLGGLFDLSSTKESATAEAIVASVLGIIDFDN